jgi:hypothetical protein
MILILTFVTPSTDFSPASALSASERFTQDIPKDE